MRALTDSHLWGGPAQAMPELHIGLRTGYCGSLTTFASWVYTLLLQLVGGVPLWLFLATGRPKGMSVLLRHTRLELPPYSARQGSLYTARLAHPTWLLDMPPDLCVCNDVTMLSLLCWAGGMYVGRCDGS